MLCVHSLGQLPEAGRFNHHGHYSDTDHRLFFHGNRFGVRHADLQRRARRAGRRYDSGRGRSQRCRWSPSPCSIARAISFSGSISAGWQTEEPVDWVGRDFLTELPQRVSVTIEGCAVASSSLEIRRRPAPADFSVPVYFLDTDLPENSEWDRTLTHYLYGGDQHYRLCQEVILGIGGVRMLRALGHTRDRPLPHERRPFESARRWSCWMKRPRRAGRAVANHDDIQAVREKCVFTTHTPVTAGHDQFPMALVHQVLGRRK